MIDRKFAPQATVLAAARDFDRAGSRIEINSAMIPMTTSSSTSVNPREVFRLPSCMIFLMFDVFLFAVALSPALGVFGLGRRRRVPFAGPGVVADDQTPAILAKRRPLFAQPRAEEHRRRRLFDRPLPGPIAKLGGIPRVLLAEGRFDRDR